MAEIKKDGWLNVITGLNLEGRDKKMSTKANYIRLSQIDIEQVYAVDKLAKKIINNPVTESFRKPPIFKMNNADEDFSKSIYDFVEPYDFFTKYIQAAKWARLYGTGFLLFGIRDGRLPHEPVDFNNIRSVDWVQPLHRWEVSYNQIQRDVSQPFYREPLIYTISEAGSSTDNSVGLMVHRSRLVRLDGEILPDELYKLNGYHHDSVLNSLLDALRNYTSSHDSAASLIDDFAQAVFKIKNLGQLIAAGKDDQVIARMKLLDATRSVVRGVVLDSEEEFSREVTSLAGLSEVINKMADRLVGESEQPHTILLGEGSTGNLSGAGESEMRQWYDYIKNLQNTYHKKALMECFKILLSARTYGGLPAGFDIMFPALEEMNEKEQSEINLRQAQADQIYIQNQVATPEEIAISRFGSGGFSLTTEINVEDRTFEMEPVETEEEKMAAQVKGALESSTEEDVQKTALNGAQVSSMVEVVLNYKQGNLDRAAAKAMIMTSFNVDAGTAEAILGSTEKIIPEAIVTDETDHYHIFDGYMSGPAIESEDGTHYHEVEIWAIGERKRIVKTEVSLDSAHHTHAVEGEQPTGASVEVKIDDNGFSEFDLVPPAKVRENARKVLGWKKDHKDEIKGITRVGLSRANRIAKGDALTLNNVKQMAKFARHEKEAKLDESNIETPWKHDGHVNWLCWGGDEGVKWAQGIVEKVKK